MQRFNYKRYARVIAKGVINSVDIHAFSEELTEEEVLLVENYLIEIANRITVEDVTTIESQEFRANPIIKGKTYV